MSSHDNNKPSKPSSSRPGGIRTLSDLNRPSASDSGSDSDGPQEYYTGGEKSGMLVQDPRNRNDVDSIFDQARRSGALQPPPENFQPSSSSRSFTGAGRVLSDENAPIAPQQPERITHDIVFWNNGFTVNDGPLRSWVAPENNQFLESIKRSECPKELEPADRRTPVSVSLIRRDTEDYIEPKKSSNPFQGVGRTLGSSSGTESAPEATVTPPLQSAPTPRQGLVVDRSQPSTSIQLRLADGTRMVAHFNHTHTIADVRSFIDASRPGGSRTYQLQAVGFPPKVLSDLTQTIQEAGLMNSVVIQKN